MTGRAGAHVVHHLSGHHVALPDGPVAGLAGRARSRVHTVAEVDVLRELIDADPRDRLLVSGRGGESLDVWAVGLDRLVTAHAEGFRRKTHELAGVGVLVARPALQ